MMTDKQREMIGGAICLWFTVLTVEGLDSMVDPRDYYNYAAFEHDCESQFARCYERLTDEQRDSLAEEVASLLEHIEDVLEGEYDDE